VARLFTIFVIALLVWGQAGKSSAQSYHTVEKLLAACKFYEKSSLTVVEAVEFEQCRSFIAGFFDGWTYARLYIREAKKTVSSEDTDICFPFDAQFTYKQLARIFIKWAGDNPAQHHHSGSQGLRSAFGHAFPCSE